MSETNLFSLNLYFLNEPPERSLLIVWAPSRMDLCNYLFFIEYLNFMNLGHRFMKLEIQIKI